MQSSTPKIVLTQTLPFTQIVLAGRGENKATLGGDGQPSDAVELALQTALRGPAGPPGPSGISEQFVYEQATPATVWSIDHGMNCYPAVVVIDSSNDLVEGDIKYVSLNEVTLTFAGAFSGTARLM